MTRSAGIPDQAPSTAATPHALGTRVDAMAAPQQAPHTGTGTVTVTEPDTRPLTGDGDHDRFAHYTRRKDAARSYVEGTPLRALCGKVWVPSRDPSRYPVCPECDKIRRQLLKRNHN